VVHISKSFHTPAVYRPISQEQSWTETAGTLFWQARKITYLMPPPALMSTAIAPVLWFNDEKGLYFRIYFNKVCDHSETGVFLRR
jgi:hypothetical protein